LSFYKPKSIAKPSVTTVTYQWKKPLYYAYPHGTSRNSVNARGVENGQIIAFGTAFYHTHPREPQM